MREAFHWLRTSADTFPCLIWYERDPLLARARRHDEFTDVLTHARQRRDAALSGLE